MSKQEAGSAARDLSRGALLPTIVRLAIPVFVGMAVQMAYYFVDLYLVARLGPAAVAGLGIAGTIQFLVMACTQVLGTGSVILVAEALGQRDPLEAGARARHAIVLGAMLAVLLLLVGYLWAGRYLRSISADDGIVAAGRSYLDFYLPGMALQFPLVALASVVRACGIAKPIMLIQLASIGLNIVLASVLINGSFFGASMGVAGAGLASSISIGVALLMACLYVCRQRLPVRIGNRLARVDTRAWMHIIRAGSAAGGEFALMFLYTAVVFALAGNLGADAQATFGLGSRLMQALLLPAMALAVALMPVVAQNLGAGKIDRVRGTMGLAAMLTFLAMMSAMGACLVAPTWIAGILSDDPQLSEQTAVLLRSMAWSLPCAGLAIIGSSFLQAVGRPLAAVAGSTLRLLMLTGFAFWLGPQLDAATLWKMAAVAWAVAPIACLMLVLFWFKHSSSDTPAKQDHASIERG